MAHLAKLGLEIKHLVDLGQIVGIGSRGAHELSHFGDVLLVGIVEVLVVVVLQKEAKQVTLWSIAQEASSGNTHLSRKIPSRLANAQDVLVRDFGVRGHADAENGARVSLEIVDQLSCWVLSNR